MYLGVELQLTTEMFEVVTTAIRVNLGVDGIGEWRWNSIVLSLSPRITTIIISIVENITKIIIGITIIVITIIIFGITNTITINYLNVIIIPIVTI